MGEQKDGIFAPTNPKRPVRLGVRTADFHSVNRGSIPLRATKKTLNECWGFFIYLKQPHGESFSAKDFLLICFIRFINP